MVLLDTNILIEIFKKTPSFIDQIRIIGVNNITISKMSIFEMILGALNKRELKEINSFLSKFSQININEQISDKTFELLNKYRLSHGLFINDAIIAATCLEYQIPLYTLNTKDFKFIDGIELY